MSQPTKQELEKRLEELKKTYVEPEMSKEAIAYWHERASEKIGCFPFYKTQEEEDEYNRLHPLPTDEELVEIFLNAGAILAAERLLKSM